MTHTKQFIEDAIEGGYEKDEFLVNEYHSINLGQALLDPKAWQAVGKTRGWIDKDYPNGEMRCSNLVGRCDAIYCDYGGFINPNEKWHHFIDHLADGKTIDQALQAIE